MATTSNEIEKAVGRGMATAAAIAAAGFGQDGVAVEILNAAGFETVRDLRACEVPENDVAKLRRLFAK